MLFCMLDGWRSRGAVTASIELPDSVSVGETADLIVHVAVAATPFPPRAEVAVDPSPLVSIEDHGRWLMQLEEGRGAERVPIEAVRRGMAHFRSLWVRWTGPMGLAWRQRQIELNAAIAILPDIRSVNEQGGRIFRRFGFEGLHVQQDRNEGSDFDALVEFQHGMDRRSIDWKQSARHWKLHAKQYRSERNNQVVFAIDSGRQMSEPVAGVPRVDRAVSAALLTAWVALKLGDRIAFHAFDSRPRLASGFVSGPGAFAEAKRIAAEIDYSGDETNYTFALTKLAAGLTRRSMIVLFTEFTDSISADFMVRAAKRIVRTHLLLVVVFRDEELESIAARQPAQIEDVTRTITAAGLLRNRRVALMRLQNLGVSIIESNHDRVGEEVATHFVDLKRRNLL
jgi:uncharacterized protein (DUF58 family)